MANETYDLNEIKRRMHGASAVLKDRIVRSAHGPRLRPYARSGDGGRLWRADALNQVATVSVPEPRMISVIVWGPLLGARGGKSHR